VGRRGACSADSLTDHRCAHANKKTPSKYGADKKKKKKKETFLLTNVFAEEANIKESN
jgi:hypothetical protein